MASPNHSPIKEKDVYALIADIGGTNARMKLIKFHKDSTDSTEVKTQFYETKDFPTFRDCLAEFLKGLENTEKYPNNATLAVAAAPFNNKLKMVNCQWPEMDGDALGKEFKIWPFNLINDFEAIGYSLLKLPKENLIPLHDAPVITGKSMAVIGSGTGLGECVLSAVPGKNGEFNYSVRPSEGGHKDFAPTDKDDFEYMQFCYDVDPVTKEMGYLSTERAFCGPGIPYIYKFLCKKEGVAPKDITAKQIFQDGQKKADPICAKALDFYSRLYGKEVSNFACDCLPYAGIYLVGGMINSILDYFTKNPDCPFLKNYFSKDKITNGVLARFPIFIVTYDELGLFGAFVKAQMDAYGEG